MNSVNLIGRLTRDPELRAVNGGEPVATLRMAYDQGRDDTGFVDVTVWGKSAVACAEHLLAGHEVAVSGRLRFREWQGRTGKRQAHEIAGSRVDFLRRPNGSDDAQPAPAAAQEGGGSEDIAF